MAIIFDNFDMAYEVQVPKLNLYLNFVKVIKPLGVYSNVREDGKLLQLLSNYVVHTYYCVAQLRKCSSSVLCMQPGVSSFSTKIPLLIQNFQELVKFLHHQKCLGLQYMET